MMGAAWDPRNWTHEQIESECRKPYRAYHKALRARHIAYYAERPEQRSRNERRPFEAHTLADAFPPGYGHLAHADIGWHTHASSAGSRELLKRAPSSPCASSMARPRARWISP